MTVLVDDETHPSVGGNGLVEVVSSEISNAASRKRAHKRAHIAVSECLPTTIHFLSVTGHWSDPKTLIESVKAFEDRRGIPCGPAYARKARPCREQECEAI